MELKYIGKMHTDFPTKFGLPRQAGLAPGLMGRIELEKEFQKVEAFRGLEGYSHIWILWEFSEFKDKEWSVTVRPPRLGGNARVGVFASRSPNRPNSIGMSVVKLERIDFDCQNGPVIYVSGIDMMDGTPVLDIKPYVASDIKGDAVCGFSDKVKDINLEVEMEGDAWLKLPEDQRENVAQILAQNPIPHYQSDPNRVYGFEYAGYEIKFRVEGGKAVLVDVQAANLD
ncbi:MAG: tRNA (N6-threonylcarbamoyladenosine(37)-N6)-methyltransferase TrmO [Clostridia bacterium]|nr:tRNA (N6-threonylcarbamoyladenosine(37)-N6)-methyltransferase TrmO [Clostridia bacterium]